MKEFYGSGTYKWFNYCSGVEITPTMVVLIMNNLDTESATIVDNICGNSSGATVESFIKPITSTMFGQKVYYLDGTGPSISVSGPHEEFFNSNFGIWIGGKHFSGGCYRPISTH